MSYCPEDFAQLYFKDYILRQEVCAALLERPNRGFTVNELNGRLGRDNSKISVEGIRRVLRDLDDLIEIETRKNPRGPPTKIYKPGKLSVSYRDPILSSVFGKGREMRHDLSAHIALQGPSTKTLTATIFLAPSDD